MDGLRGVWHGGPFLRDKRYRFYPKQMMFGTDPVAIDRQLIDVIDDKRKRQGAISVWERTTDKKQVRVGRNTSASRAISSSRRSWAWAFTTQPRSRGKTSSSDGGPALTRRSCPAFIGTRVRRRLPAVKKAGIERIYVPAARQEAWSKLGVDAIALDPAKLTKLTDSRRAVSDEPGGGHFGAVDRRQRLAAGARSEAHLLLRCAGRGGAAGDGGSVRV